MTSPNAYISLLRLTPSYGVGSSEECLPFTFIFPGKPAQYRQRVQGHEREPLFGYILEVQEKVSPASWCRVTVKLDILRTQCATMPKTRHSKVKASSLMVATKASLARTDRLTKSGDTSVVAQTKPGAKCDVSFIGVTSQTPYPMNSSTVKATPDPVPNDAVGVISVVTSASKDRIQLSTSKSEADTAVGGSPKIASNAIATSVIAPSARPDAALVASDGSFTVAQGVEACTSAASVGAKTPTSFSTSDHSSGAINAKTTTKMSTAPSKPYLSHNNDGSTGGTIPAVVNAIEAIATGAETPARAKPTSIDSGTRPNPVTSRIIAAATNAAPADAKAYFVARVACWTSQNITEQVSVRVRPCVQRVPGPIHLVVLSEVKCFTAKQPS